MNPALMPREVDRLRAVCLPPVLLAAGATPDPHDKTRWDTPEGVISVTGCKFFNWNRGVGGGGAIDLVIHLYGLDFRGAVAWLSRRFPGAAPAPSPHVAPNPPGLKLPKPHTAGLWAVKRYLLEQRLLSAAVVDRLILAGDIYADHHANAVFLLRGKHNAPVGAELRGTGPRPWRGMAPGSRKNLGYFSVRHAHIEAIVLCESAIDAISCYIIQPRRWCISTAGATPHPVWLPEIIQNGQPVYCAFDADPTGDHMAETMIRRYPAITRLRPPRHDWNDLLSSRV
jgi:hypothetical protein